MLIFRDLTHITTHAHTHTYTWMGNSSLYFNSFCIANPAPSLFLLSAISHSSSFFSPFPILIIFSLLLNACIDLRAQHIHKLIELMVCVYRIHIPSIQQNRMFSFSFHWKSESFPFSLVFLVMVCDQVLCLRWRWMYSVHLRMRCLLGYVCYWVRQQKNAVSDLKWNEMKKITAMMNSAQR